MYDNKKLLRRLDIQIPYLSDSSSRLPVTVGSEMYLQAMESVVSLRKSGFEEDLGSPVPPPGHDQSSSAERRSNVAPRHDIPGAWRKLYETMVLDFLSNQGFVLQLEAYGDDLVDG